MLVFWRLPKQFTFFDIELINDILSAIFLLSLYRKINHSCQYDNQAAQNVFFIFHILSKLSQRNYFDIFQPEHSGL